MPIHDWTLVEAGIFHDFHHAWIEQIKRALNSGLLPGEYYALAEQFAGGFGPDVLTLEGPASENGSGHPALYATPNGGTGVLLAPPQVRLTAETDMEFYRRKEKVITIRHVTGDEVVAVIEVVSPSNKKGRAAMQDFIDKAAELLESRIHLLILDVQPPTRRDPNGVHGVIWEEITGEEYSAPPDKPLTLVAYEATLSTRAYVATVAVGDVLPDMPLFLAPRAHVPVPLEETYQTAFSFVPRRWQGVLNTK